MSEISDYQVFAHATAQNHALYRAIMDEFRTARSFFVLHLSPEKILAALYERGFRTREGEAEGGGAVDRDYVELCLQQLERWGNLKGLQDSSEASTVQEFVRKRRLYQLTAEGEAAEAALATFVQELAKPGELQTLALEDITLQLDALLTLVREEGEPDPARVRSILDEITRRFEELTSQAQRFLGGLQRQIDLYDVELGTFLDYKDMLLDYLNRFVAALVTSTGAIAERLTTLDGEGVDPLLDAAASRELGDALQRTPALRLERLRQWRARWEGLRRWFLGEDNRRSQADILRRRALQAIPDLLGVVAAFNERNTTRADRVTDLRALALWFMECDTDAEAHRLWRATFGLHPARHLLVNADTLAAWEADPPSPRTRWLEAPRLAISPRLRQYGSTGRRGRPAPIQDRSKEKAHLARLAAEEARQVALARERLLALAACHISEVGELDPRGFHLFYDLLTRAIATKREPTDRGTARTVDGTLEIVLEPCRPLRSVAVRSVEGTLSTWDARIQILDLFPKARRTAEAG
jgi:uncharacterized protein (TIGR02677 family)